MSKVRVCFLGTPEFAVTSLKALIADDHFEIVGVVTQPDRPAGRKMQLTPSPVKMLAMNHGLHVITPESLKKNPQRVEEIRSWGAEVAVVVAFGQILTQEFLDMFPYGAVNVHGSILPRWRGAAPIQRGIEAGDKESGVALQKMVKKLDAGDIIGIRRVPLDDEITAMELHDKLAVLGADLLRVELMDYIRGNLAPHPQDEAQVTYAHKIEKAEGEIKWMLPAVEIHNKVRALTMGPGTFTTLGGKKVKVHRTQVSEKAGAHPDAGVVVDVNEEFVAVQCGGGVLNLLELQPESRNRMKVSDFLKGHPLKVGDRFGV
ncbi:methionyl-tRNA formyltransferase [Bdellovibrio sp. HCB337]|uniref:methionyl-tRNA formyltransferase n=1 Tax=Bdellovibrio sp. HCB337 TaxID=3394358 RepID=UPI0039A4EC4C